MEVPGKKKVDQSSLPSSGDEKDIIVKCGKHQEETVRFYCRKHEVVGCGDCMIPDHNACAPESIKNQSKNFHQSEHFKTFLSKVDELTAENKKHEYTVTENKRINKTTMDKVLGEIRKFRIDVNNYLDKMEANTISEAKQFFSDNDEVLTKLEQDCKGISSKIDKMKQMLNTEIYMDSVLFINTIECKTRLSEMEQKVTQVKSKNTKQIEFVCDEQLQRLVTSARKLGSLTMSSIFPSSKSLQMTQTKIDKTVKSESRNAGETKSIVKVVSPVKEIGVGARVRYNHPHSIFTTSGTVTAVHPDGKVRVKWDKGETDGPYAVGKEGDVTLI